MKTAITLSLLLGLAIVVAAQIGCGATPATQTDKTAPVAQVEKVVETEPPQSLTPLSKSSQAEVVEVGYKKGMHIPGFGMSLLDGTKVTSVKLVEEGKPTFVYFHATW